MILLKRLPVAGYCDWTFEVGRQSRVGALEVTTPNCTKIVFIVYFYLIKNSAVIVFYVLALPCF